MKKISSLIILLTLFIISCKKKNTSPEQPEQATTSSTSSSYKKIKLVRTVTNNSNSRNIQTYNYNSSGKLISTSGVDSSFSNNVWTVNNSSVFFTYNSFGNVIMELQSTGSFTTASYYTYDSNNKLIYSTDSYSTDTIKYFYNSGIITAIDDNSSFLTKQYYSQNLDSIVNYNKSNPAASSKTILSHNSTLNLANAYLRQQWPSNFQVDQYEITGSIYYYGTSSYPTSYTRVYDNNNYPLKETKSSFVSSTVDKYFVYY